MHSALRACLLSFGFILATLVRCSSPPPSENVQPRQALDLVIANGHIIDGTGSPWYSGDVGIRDGRIAAIGKLADAPRKRTIDAQGKVVRSSVLVVVLRVGDEVQLLGTEREPRSLKAERRSRQSP